MNRLFQLILILLLFGCHLGVAATNRWQGGDGNWTNANWSVNGASNQALVAPPTIYLNDDFVFDAAGTVSSANRPALDGGSWTQTAGTVQLTGGGSRSGAAFGINGTPTSVLIGGNAVLTLFGSGSAGTALSGRQGAMIVSGNAAVHVLNKNLEIQGGFSVTVSNAAAITAPYIDFTTAGANSAFLKLHSGTVTLSSSNPVQTAGPGTPPGNRINFTGPAGAAQIIHTDNSAPANNLAAKIAAGFFCIDGTVITNTSQFVAGRRFNIATVGNTDTLQLLATAGGALNISTTHDLPAVALVRNPVSLNSQRTTLGNGSVKGQTVSFSNSVALTNVVFMLDDAVTSTDLSGLVTLEMHRCLNGLPFGGPIFSDAGTLPAGLTNGAFLQLTPSAPVALKAGQYAISLSTVDASLDFKLTGADAYARGNFLLKTNAAWSIDSSLDWVFAIQGTTQADAPIPTNRPNILVILADDLGWTDLSTGKPNLGNPSDFYQTPNLARLAEQGLSFNSCYVNPNCAPTRAALLSGQSPCRSGNGVYNVDDLNRGTGTPSLVGPTQNEDVPAATYTLAEMLKDAGYVTAHLGKYHVGGHDAGAATLPLAQGFDWNFGGTPSGHPGNYEADVSGVFHNNVGAELDSFGAPYTMNYITNCLVPFANGFNPATINGNVKHLQDAEADAAVAFIRDHISGAVSNRPFYLQWHSYGVHGPVKSRADIKAKYDGLPPGTNHTKPAYAGLVEGMDQAIGRVLAFLDDPNSDGSSSDSIATNTLVIFFSDNGGEDSQTKNTPLRAWKGSHYEGGLRVPLIVRWLGHVPTNQITSTMVQHIDVYPTLMEVAGGNPGGVLDGVSFASHMLNPASPRHRGPIFYHFPGYLDNRARPCSTIIDEIGGKRYKLIYNYDYTYDPAPGDNILKALTQPWELYNLTDDLGESRNLIDGTYSGWLIEGTIADELAAKLHGWLTQPDPTWNARQPVYRVGGGIVPYAPADVPDAPAPGGAEFRATAIAVNHAAGQMTLTWNSEPGFIYSIWASPDLETWSPILGSITATNASTSRTVILSTNRFYRIGVAR